MCIRDSARTHTRPRQWCRDAIRKTEVEIPSFVKSVTSCLHLLYMSYICIPFSVVHRFVLHVIHVHTFFLSYTDPLYMSYSYQSFSVVHRPALHDIHTHTFFSVVHRPVLHVIHMETFFCRTPTCSSCHTYGNLFMSYQRPILLVIRMHTLFSHTQACCTCNTSICVVSSAVRRPVVHVIHQYV